MGWYTGCLSNMSVKEGQPVTKAVNITNTSKQNGVAVAATLTTKISAVTSDGTPRPPGPMGLLIAGMKLSNTVNYQAG